jgi:hypothetical protein
VDYTISIQSSPDQVFLLLTSVEKRRQWEPALLEERLYPDAEIRPGTRVYQIRRLLGGKIESQFTVAAFEPGHVYSVKSLPDSVPEYAGTYTLTPIDGGTRVDFVLSLDTRGLPFGRLLEPFVVRFARKMAVDMLKRLQATLETS